MRRSVVVLAMFLAVAAFPFASQGVDKDPAAIVQPVTFEQLFGSTASENVIEPTPSTGTVIPSLPPLSDPVIVKMLLPLLQQSWEYPSAPAPVANSDPRFAFPIGVGPVATGGKLLNLRVSLGQFESPMDLYFVLSAPAMDPDHLFIMRSDDSLEAYSVEGLRERNIKKLDKILGDLKGIQPWKASTMGNLNATLVNNVSVSKLPSGTYEMYLIAAPAGRADAYYQWKTNFPVKNVSIPELSIIPWWPSQWDWSLKPGDLTIKSAVPVQVIDGWPQVPLIKGKGTVFRVNIYSTFSVDVNARVRLTLPPDSWSYVESTANGNHLIRGWGFPNAWGPLTFKPGVETEIILPYIPDSKRSDPVSMSNPYGVMESTCIDNLRAPDVRVLPCPSDVNKPIAFTVEVDPDNSVEEVNETNNTFSVSDFYPFETLPVKLLFVPMKNVAGCSPEIGGALEAYARYATGFMLGTFPISDEAISYQIEAATTTFPCSQNPQSCGTDPNATCGYAIIEDAATIGWLLDILALGRGADIAFGVYPGFGGQKKSNSSAVVGGTIVAGAGGDEGDFMNAAHEATHVLTGAGDIYFLDCNACYLEAYAEQVVNNQTTRDYCCDQTNNDQTSCANGRAVNPLCFVDNGAIVCDPNNTTKNCAYPCNYANNPIDCFNKCFWNYPGRLIARSPDCRTNPPADRGFWANRYFDIDPTTFGLFYLMDCERTDQRWVDPPFRWMRASNSVAHCTGDQYQDGYLNLWIKFFNWGN